MTVVQHILSTTGIEPIWLYKQTIVLYLREATILFLIRRLDKCKAWISSLQYEFLTDF